jgi:hypothetical protein
VCRLQTARRPLMSHSEKPFNVSDRRHFTTDGRPRDDSEEQSGTDEHRGPTAPAGSPPRSPGAPADFSQFLLTLAAQASLLLSGEGLPEGTDPASALEGARSVIAILEMLKDKTEGRRTGAEEALLDELLFQLRMSYVEKTRAAGA